MSKIDYLIIGNGIAGLSAAREIRKTDKTSRITMVGREEYPTYYRVKLSKYLSEDFSEDDILVGKEDWYEENQVDLILRKVVDGINPEEQEVLLDDGSVLEYGKLLIATGSRPFVPPITGKFKEGFFTLRTLKDLNYIKDYLKDKDKVTVLGGGLLGLELASSLKKMGKEVSIIELADHLLSKQLNQDLSIKLKELLEEEGFKIYTSSRITDLLGEGYVDGLILNDKDRIETGAVIASVGVIPNLELLEGSNIKTNRGLIVNQRLETSAKNIYGAGDVIEYKGKGYGLWTVANDQGRLAARSMMGEEVDYEEPTLFTSLKIDGVEVFSIGDVLNYDEVLEETINEKGIYNKVFIKDSKLVGGILFGDLKKQNLIRKSVMAGESKEEFLKNNKDFK